MKEQIRFNEKLLLDAGFPRDFVRAMRGLLLSVGTGVSIANLAELESLLLTMKDGRSATSNIAQQIQLLSEQIALARRQQASDLQIIVRQLETLAIQAKPNLAALERRLAALENYVEIRKWR